MSTFPADWLALREPYDRRARNPVVRDAAVALLGAHPSVTIVDLACGTGANLRALAPYVTARQTWRLADNDLGLLARADGSARPDGTTIMTAPIDLVHDLEAALDGPVDLVTCSALLDLVSAEWLERLAVECAVRSMPLYASLSYDGRIVFEPADPTDAAILAAVNAHQLGDKGFGPALGPAAAATAIARFETLGYSVVHGPADWFFGPDDRAIQTEVCAGWAGAAQETGDLALPDIVGWLTRRRDAIAAGRSSIRVGHIDLFSQPMRERSAERSQSNSSSSPS
jgi:hypothetical protein